MVAIEIHGRSRPPVDWGDGTIAIASENNLHDMVHAIGAQIQMHSIDVLRITSPGIIAVLTGLLLPAVQRVKEATAHQTSGKSLSALDRVKAAAGHKIRSVDLKETPQVSQMRENLRYIEQSLNFLKPYFSSRARVEIRAANVAVGDINGDALKKLAQAFGVPVLIGGVGSDIVSWRRPVTTATPTGAIQKV
jgi:hypothetical protein